MVGEGGPQQQPPEQAQPTGPVTTPATGNVLNQRQSLFRRMQTMKPNEVEAYRKEAAGLGVQEDGWQRAFGTINKRNEEAKTVERWRVDKEARTPSMPVRGGDMTKEAMGTPEEQARVQQMLKEGEAYATADNTGNVSTAMAAQQSAQPTSGSAPTVNSTGNGRGAKAQQRREAATPPPSNSPTQSTAARQKAMGDFMESVKTTAGSVMDRFRSRPAPAPDGSKIMPTNLRQQKDKKGNVTSYDLAPLVKNGAGPDVRINRTTGLPFGYSQNQSMPAGADAAMKQRGADYKARMKANDAQTKSRFASMPQQLPPTAQATPQAPAQTRVPNTASTGRSDGYQAKNPIQFQREVKAHQDMKKKGLSGDSWRSQGRDDLAAAFPNQMSNRQAFGHEIPKDETPEQARQAEAKSVASVTPQRVAQPTMQPTANKSRFARVRR